MSNDPTKACEHPDIMKEKMMGGWTGDYVCVKCRAVFSGGEKRKIEAERGGKPNAAQSEETHGTK